MIKTYKAPRELQALIPNVKLKVEYNYNLNKIFVYYTTLDIITGVVSFSFFDALTFEETANEIIRQAQLTLKDIMTNNLQ